MMVEGVGDGEVAEPIELRVGHQQVVAQLNSRRRRIWVVGALRASWEQLMGVAKWFGIHQSVFRHSGYNDLKARLLLERVNLAHDFGGPTWTHSASRRRP